MSIDFIALFDITSEDATAEWLRERLSSDDGFAAGLIEQYRDRWEVKSWVVEFSPVTGRAGLLGPGGFAISFRRGTLELYHMMPFGRFADDPASREALRRACLAVADLVGTSRAIYTHELMPYRGEGLAQIEEDLRSRVGPPAASFAELEQADYFGPRAWYVETFGDLRAAGASRTERGTGRTCKRSTPKRVSRGN